MKKKAGIGCAAIILLFLCGIVANLMGGGDERVVEQQNEEQIIESTATVSEPASTAEPTSEPDIEPSSTPLPTNTPQPTETIDPEIQAEQEYCQFLSGVLDLYIESSTIFAEQNRAAGENPNLIRDSNWLERTALAVVGMESASDLIIERENVPSGFLDFHNQFTEVARLTNRSMGLYTEGVDELDPTKINRSTELMNQATDIIENMPRASEICDS